MPTGSDGPFPHDEGDARLLAWCRFDLDGNAGHASELLEEFRLYPLQMMHNSRWPFDAQLLTLGEELVLRPGTLEQVSCTG